jgi:transposase
MNLEHRLSQVEPNHCDLRHRRRSYCDAIIDGHGAARAGRRARPSTSSQQKVCTYGGHAGRLVWWAQDKSRVALETVERSPGAEGFAVIRRRWVVECTFAWIMKR